MSTSASRRGTAIRIPQEHRGAGQGFTRLSDPAGGASVGGASAGDIGSRGGESVGLVGLGEGSMTRSRSPASRPGRLWTVRPMR